MSKLDPETVNKHLIEVALPSSIENMKNPTPEYIFELIMQFMNMYGIDASTIRKPTFEQLNTLSLADENPEMVTLINMAEVMTGICKLIYFKDFNILDLTSPVSKRARKFASFLANFVLYANNTLAGIEEQLESTKAQVQEINEQVERKDMLVKVKNSKALEVAKKLEGQQQLLMEIEEMKARKEARKSQITAIETKLKSVENEKLKAVQLHGKLDAEAMKIRKTTQDLESKVVKSPQRYEASLRELMEQKRAQIEKREVMQEKIRIQKPAIEKVESYHAMVLQEHAKFPEVTEAYKRFTESKKMMEEVKKKVAEMRNVIEQEEMMYNQEAMKENKHASNSALEKVREQCEQNLASVRKEYNELLNEKRVLEIKLEDEMTRLQDIHSQTEKFRSASKHRLDKEKAFVKYCQELYDAEISKERQMRRRYGQVWSECPKMRPGEK